MEVPQKYICVNTSHLLSSRTGKRRYELFCQGAGNQIKVTGVLPPTHDPHPTEGESKELGEKIVLRYVKDDINFNNTCLLKNSVMSKLA